MKTYYLKISSCVSKNTYKYFFPDTATGKTVWDVLVNRYGHPKENNFFNVKEITTEKFRLRTTFLHDPLTIIVMGHPDDEFAILHEALIKDQLTSTHTWTQQA